MQRAQTLSTYQHPAYPDVKIETLRWPVSTVRVTGKDVAQMQAFAEQFLQTWRGYSDAAADVLATTEENGESVAHNTVTPILHYDSEAGYVLDLVPRNNRTSEEYPAGIFHPHPEIHHIKKENIGLIEVMGLAILPSRLEKQSALVAKVLAGRMDAAEAKAAAPEHSDWIDFLVEKYGCGTSEAKALEIVKQEIGAKFETCLEHAGVFKQTPAGQAAFDRFLAKLGCAKL